MAKITCTMGPRIELKLLSGIAPFGGFHVLLTLDQGGGNCTTFRLHDGPFDCFEAPRKLQQLLDNMQVDQNWVEVSPPALGRLS